MWGAFYLPIDLHEGAAPTRPQGARELQSGAVSPTSCRPRT